ncbi:P-loop containing nucleoside triphosphate hydrolase protein [Panaeolus papilionaceus]|nr:P-loop containing nucleoside triphosphate hydrolase protein [Panaeolus papilionaceus]
MEFKPNGSAEEDKSRSTFQLSGSKESKPPSNKIQDGETKKKWGFKLPFRKNTSNPKEQPTIQKAEPGENTAHNRDVPTGEVRPIQAASETSDRESVNTEDVPSSSPPSGSNNAEHTMAKEVTLDTISEDDIVIGVLGATGVGKTTFIDALCGGQAKWLKIGHDLHAGTMDISCVKIAISGSNASIVLVDTPGFDDPQRPNAKILEIIATWLEKSCRKGRLLNGVIYLHRINDIRFNSGASTTLSIFKKMYGGKGYERVVLVTSNWNEVHEDEMIETETREQQLLQEIWALLLKRNRPAAYSRFDCTTAASGFSDAKAILGKLLAAMVGEKDQKLKLLIQEEMVDKKISLPQTTAGKAIFTPTDTVEYHLGKLKGLVGLSRNS